MTQDKEVKGYLRVFSERMPHFLEFLKKKKLSYLKRLNLPVFKESLLLNKDVLHTSRSMSKGRSRSVYVE